ncbi:MAG: hypothetical protein A2Y94_01980 [Caldithrix sp. RBG_13_44_9]|nr:MAG: hypothetical protein A2Y94_01980 [Caldithrix sp. RBG_13_44_9]
MNIKHPICWLIFLLTFVSLAASQIPLEYLGLKNQGVTTIGVNYGILAAGTNRHGVYWQTVSQTFDTTWNLIGLDSAEVFTVYPHKSGPLGWAVGAGIKPDSSYTHFIYCSFMGAPFEPLDTGISDSLINLIHELDGFADPSICGETYAAAGGALYRRNFGDSVWVPLYTATIEGNVQTVKVRDEYPGLVMVGGVEGFAGRLLLRSLDYGNTWDWLSPPDMVSDIDFAGALADTIFLVGGNVYRSSDAGISWTEIFNTSWIYIKKVIYDPITSTVFIAGSDAIVYGNAILFYSRDLGNSWIPIPLGIADPIIDLDMDESGMIYFATPDSGVYRFNPVVVMLETDRQNSLTENFQLFQNYPNPFNPETVISWQLAVGNEVQLKIYDLLGQEVRTLVNEWHEAGYHSVNWDGRDQSGNSLSSGIYLCQLTINDFQQIRKMLLVR